MKPKNKEYLPEDLQICLLNEAVADLLIAEAKPSCHIHGQSRGLKARPVSRARLYNSPNWPSQEGTGAKSIEFKIATAPAKDTEKVENTKTPKHR